MFGELESLNVSVASGVALFEIINQKMSIKRKTD
jgi:tRNA G18 (ribose-2'-O)-methylase SpoU